jgi:hypothetical protein
MHCKLRMKSISNKWIWVIRCIVCEKCVLVWSLYLRFILQLCLNWRPLRALSRWSPLFALNPCHFGAKGIIHLANKPDRFRGVNLANITEVYRAEYSQFERNLWMSLYSHNKRHGQRCLHSQYTGCPRRNVPDFGWVFLMLKYTDITQNTYILSWTVTEIMAKEVWTFDRCYTLIDYQIHIKTGRNMWFL